MDGPCLCGDPACGRCFPQAPKPKHYSAVVDGMVVGTRSSQRTRIYTHVVLATFNIIAADQSVTGTKTTAWSWHAGEKNAAAGLRSAQGYVGHEYNRTLAPYPIEQLARVELAPVIVTRRRQQTGKAVQL